MKNDARGNSDRTPDTSSTDVTSAPEWQNCLALIGHAEVVSFDFFDTLVTRLAATPEAVQRYVGHRLETRDPSLEGFFTQRKEAETAARASRPELGDVDMDMIYAEFRRNPPWTESAGAMAQALEVEIDHSFIVPRGDVFELLAYAKAHEKRTIIVSDSYVPITFIRQVLARCGWANLVDEIYLSSEHLARKDSGALWDIVITRERLADRPFVHFGDNPRSDIAGVRERGLNAMLLSNPACLATERGLDHAGGEDWRADVLLGPLVARFGANPFTVEGPTITDGRDFGYRIYGPIFLAFFAWLTANPTLRQMRRLYFAGREGFFLQRLFDQLSAEFEIRGLPPTVYLPISRRAVIMAGQAVTFDPSRIMNSGDFAGELEGFLSARLGITLEPADLFALPIRLPEDEPYVERIIRILDPVIVPRARREREAMAAYCRQCGLMDDDPMGLVDIGYSGTIQAGLQQVLGRPLNGFYMATSPRVSAVTKGSGRAFGCFQDALAGEMADKNFMAKTVLLEALLTAPHGQLSHFRLDPFGVAFPVFGPQGRSQAHFSELIPIFEGGLDYCRDLIGSVGLEVLDALLPARLAAFRALDGVLTGRITVGKELKQALYLEDQFCGNGEIPGLKPR